MLSPERQAAETIRYGRFTVGQGQVTLHNKFGTFIVPIITCAWVRESPSGTSTALSTNYQSLS